MVDPEVQELEQVIIALDTLFEAGEDCIHPLTGQLVTNTEYDRLRKRLEELAPNSPVLQKVTASKLSSTAKKVKHDPPMTSISKAIGTLSEKQEELKKWQDRVLAELSYKDSPEKWSVQAYKRDGVAVALYYVDGKLNQAALRPRKSEYGEDVTGNAVFVEGVPQELWEHDKDGKPVRFLPVTCCIRGEIECKKSVFKKIKADWQNPVYSLNQEPANPRNYAAGSIRQFTDPTITKERKLTFTGYSIVAWTSKQKEFAFPSFKTEIERAKYANAVLKVPFVQVRPFRQQDLDMLEKLSASLDYGVDGVIISVNNLEDAEQMGTHGNKATGNPKGKIAWKFAEEEAEVIVEDYIFTPGRTGKLTPVIMFKEPVQLAGTTVSQCTGHSLGFMNGTSKSSLGEIGAGARLVVIKSGEIIPKAIKILQKGNYPFVAPRQCPSCNSRLVVEQGEDGSDLVCENEFCGVRAVARLTYYLSTLGVKGIAERTLTQILTNDLVESVADLYKLTVSKLEKIGFTSRQALLTVARVYMVDDPTSKSDDELDELIDEAYGRKLKVPGSTLIAALGIPGAGPTTGQALMGHFGSFSAVRGATLEQLAEVQDVGDATARAVYEFFVNNKTWIDELLRDVEPESPKQGKLTGKTFVFTGGFEGGKQFWENKVKDQGGKVSGSVGKTTHYLVVGENAGSKAEKAKSLGVPQITPEELEKML